MSVPNIVAGLMMAVIYGLMGSFVRRRPETLSAYSMMTPQRRAQVDLQGAGRFAERMLYVAAAVSAVAAFLPVHILVVVLPPAAVLVVGSIMLRRYDKGAKVKK